MNVLQTFIVGISTQAHLFYTSMFKFESAASFKKKFLLMVDVSKPAVCLIFHPNKKSKKTPVNKNRRMFNLSYTPEILHSLNRVCTTIYKVFPVRSSVFLILCLQSNKLARNRWISFWNDCQLASNLSFFSCPPFSSCILLFCNPSLDLKF